MTNLAGSAPWKLNVGCGLQHIPGYLNIDSEPQANPDLCWDIEKPWDLPNDCVSHIVAKHVLEHLHDLRTFFTEAYRVMRQAAEIEIIVPHPRSDHYLGDPTHVRPIIGGTLDLLSKQNCAYYREHGYSNTPLATYWDVDFRMVTQEYALTETWKSKLDSMQAALEAIDTYNNVATEIRFILHCVKA